MDAGSSNSPGAFMEHQRDRRIDELHGAGGAGWLVGGAVRVLRPDRTPGAIAVQGFSKLLPAEGNAMGDELMPGGRPSEIAHQLARHREGKIEAADPRAGAQQQRFERGERFEPFDFLQVKNSPAENPGSGGDGLRLARCAGEIDAVDSHSRYWAFHFT